MSTGSLVIVPPSCHHHHVVIIIIIITIIIIIMSSSCQQHSEQEPVAPGSNRSGKCEFTGEKKTLSGTDPVFFRVMWLLGSPK